MNQLLAAQEELVITGLCPTAVLGRGGDFVLIQLGEGIDNTLTAQARAKGFVYYGVLAIRHGHGEASCEYESNVDCLHTMMNAALEYARLHAEKLCAGDTVEWLRALHRLADSRT